MASTSPPAGVSPPPGYHWDPNIDGENPGDPKGAYVSSIHVAYGDGQTIQTVWYPNEGTPAALQDKYVTVDGHKTLAGTYSADGLAKFTPFTPQELQAHVKAETAAGNSAADKAAQKAGFKNVADQKAAAVKANAGTAAGGYDPNANAGAAAANNNPWDNLAAGNSGDYSKSKITTGYVPAAKVAAGGGGGASSYSGIYQDSAPGGINAASDTLENLLKNFANSGPDEIKKVQQELQNAGIGSGIQVNGVADTSTLVAYRGLLQNTLLMQQNGQQVTPDDLLASLAKSSKSKTTTSTNVTLTNPAQAHQALLTAFGDKLGRKPTAGEALAFTSALNSYEKANPSVSTQTTDASGQNVTNATTTDKGTGSLSFVNDFANNYTQTDPATAGEYHAAQSLDFYNLALSSLANSPVSTGNPD